MTTLQEIGIGFGYTALLAMAWRYVRPVISWLFGLIIVTENVVDPETNRILRTYLVANSKKFAGAGKKITNETKTWVKPLQDISVVFYRQLSMSNMFYVWRNPRKRRVPIMVV